MRKLILIVMLVFCFSPVFSQNFSLRNPDIDDKMGDLKKEMDNAKATIDKKLMKLTDFIIEDKTIAMNNFMLISEAGRNYNRSFICNVLGGLFVYGGIASYNAELKNSTPNYVTGYAIIGVGIVLEIVAIVLHIDANSKLALVKF